MIPLKKPGARITIGKKYPKTTFPCAELRESFSLWPALTAWQLSKIS